MGDVAEEYRIALADLTFNSKPIINVLTMLAEENIDRGSDIVKTIYDRICEVDVEQKLPSLYLLDSILKNIGGDYVNYISTCIKDTFCHVFESAVDERKRMSLFKLRNTWTQIISAKILHDLDVRCNKTDQNWPINRNIDNSTNIAQNKIHVNPKFLQKPEPVKATGNSLQTKENRNGQENAITPSTNSKERLMEEEKRVKEQLKVLQTEKLKRDREQRELMLRKKQIERERVLAEQKRQLELLRKQQLSMTTISTGKEPKQGAPNVNTSSEQPFTKKDPIKDPRLRITPPNSQEFGKTVEKVTSPTSLSKAISPRGTSKKSKGAVSVMNKIMNNLSKKGNKPSQERNKTSSEPIKAKDSNKYLNNANKFKSSPSDETKKTSPENPKSKIKTTKSSPSVIAKTSVTSTPITTTASISTITNASSVATITTTTVAAATPPTQESTNEAASSSNPPPLPFTAAFAGLSSKDMQIAAQAAAIATAMHQMQKSGDGKFAPEQLVQLVQIMNGASTMMSGQPTTTTSTTSSTTAAVSVNTVENSQESKQPSSENKDVMMEKTENKEIETKPKSDIENKKNEKRKEKIEDQKATSIESKTISETKEPSKEKKKDENLPLSKGKLKNEIHRKQKSDVPSSILQTKKIRDRSPHDKKTESRKNLISPEQSSEKKKVSNVRENKSSDVRVKTKSPIDVNMKSSDTQNTKKTSDISEVKKLPSNESKKTKKTEKEPSTSQNEKDTARRERSPSDKLEPPPKKSRDMDPNERSRKARARSPSRYYCRIEKKMETEKRVEEKEKELKNQRIRKNSDGEDNQIKAYEQFVERLGVLEKQHTDSNTPVNLSTLDNFFKQIYAKFKSGQLTSKQNKEIMKKVDTFASFIAGKDIKMIERLLNPPKIEKQSPIHSDNTSHRQNIENQSDDTVRTEYRHHNRSTTPPISNIPPKDMRDSPPSFQNREVPPHGMREEQFIGERFPSHVRHPRFIRRGGPPFNRGGQTRYPRDGPRFSARGRFPGPYDGPRMRGDTPPPHMRDGPPPHGRDGPPPHGRDGPPPHGRDGPTPHGRDGPPHHGRDGPPPHGRDGPPPHMRDGPPPHMRDGPPPHMRDGPPPHMRDGPPTHMRDGPPPHMGDGPPPHMRDGPPPRMRDGAPPRMRDGPPPRMRDGPPPHMRDGPPPHMRDGPPPHMREGPPTHMRDGPPTHMRDGPPTHMRDGPPTHMRDGPPTHMRDGPPPHRREGPPPHRREGPPSHRREGPPPHRRDGPPPHMRDGPPPHMRDGPPHMRDHHARDEPAPHRRDMIEGQPHMQECPSRHTMEGPSGEGFQPPIFNESQPAAPQLDVSGLLGQLMAAGVIEKTEEQVDMSVPEISLQIDQLKNRHAGIIQQLFLGMQCSSCGERFPETERQQYRDHLDWHFRENRREKDGSRKVASRSWYSNLTDWIEYSDRKRRDDGKVMSKFFESEKNDTPALEGDNVKFLGGESKSEEKVTSVPVDGDEGNGLCGVCMDPLEQYWDEYMEEWRFKNAMREGKKTYHVDCFKDYVPCEEEEGTPATTPTATKNRPFEETQTELSISTGSPIKRTSILTDNLDNSQPSAVYDDSMATTTTTTAIVDDSLEANDNSKTDTREIADQEPERTDTSTDDTEQKLSTVTDEYIADSPEYPIIASTGETTPSDSAMETDNKMVTEESVISSSLSSC